jgi:hypothetical protein
MRGKFDHQFDFGFGEQYAHAVVPYRAIETEMPSIPGLYSWHFRLPRGRADAAMPFLASLFQTEELDVSVRANMRQRWSGVLRSETDAFGNPLSTALAAAFFAVAYPLYIGISVDLKKRLKTHKEQLELYKEQIPTFPWSSSPSDTDEESACFGSRLGEVFRRSRYFETEWLYVKYVSIDLDDGRGREEVMSDLRAAETTCNTLFHPVFGRR